MKRIVIEAIYLFLSLTALAQQDPAEAFISDPVLANASVSICIADASSGEIILAHEPDKSLIPASVIKLVTTAAALETLGPDHTFTTGIGYTGSFNRKTGTLRGDIIIKGGGDPALGSKYFAAHYGDFLASWIKAIMDAGIKRVKGRVVADDSYFDYQPVPAKWLWEDAGNYYGAGAYGLSAFDNTFEIHLKTGSENSIPVITSVMPAASGEELTSFLISAGKADKGYVFAAPYSKSGWMAGTVPVEEDDFILRASVTDPPLVLAGIMNDRLEKEGIKISCEPSTSRLSKAPSGFTGITETVSPPLDSIIEVLNHESVNLFAEHILKELGKRYRNSGTTAAGLEIVRNFIAGSGINASGIFQEDGSGLSPLNSINASGLTGLLLFMKQKGRYFPEYLSSLANAGSEGTLKNCFRETVFTTRLQAKSGSMTRVKAYAGYFRTISGREMAFSIIVNNFSGPSRHIVEGIENLVSGIITSK